MSDQIVYYDPTPLIQDGDISAGMGFMGATSTSDNELRQKIRDLDPVPDGVISDNDYTMIDNMDIVNDVSGQKVTFGQLKAQMQKDGFITKNEMIQSMTYEAAAVLKNSGNLKPNTLILITNNKTTYRQPGTNIIKNGPIEPIIVKAVSNNQISSIAYSTVYPTDVLTYDFTDDRAEDRTETVGSGTPRTGRILRRECVKNGERNNLDGDWRNEEYVMLKGTGIAWVAGNAVTKDSVYQVGTTLYLAINDGIPTSVDDTYYFYVYGQTNEYKFPLGFIRTGLTLNMVDYAERAVFHASLDHTGKTVVRSKTIKPEQNISHTLSLASSTEYRGLPGLVFMFSSEANKPKGNTIYSYNPGLLVIGSFNRVGENSEKIVLEGNNNLVDVYCNNSIIKGNSNKIWASNNKLDIFGSGVTIDEYSHLTTVIGNRTKVGKECYGSTYVGNHLHSGDKSYNCRIYGTFSDIGFSNANTKTGLNFNYISIDSAVAPGNLFSITEIHNRINQTKIEKGTDLKKWAVRMGANGIQDPPLQLI